MISTQEKSATTNERAPKMNGERKSCSHYCYPSNLKKCCSCEDLRPIPSAGEDGYASYVDGVGWTTTACRNHGYCPVCNTKNYDKWMVRVTKETERKQREDHERYQEQEQKRMAEEDDRSKHTDKNHGRIEYSSGNVYVGDLLDGQPHGNMGRMDYADNDDNILYYEGAWANGKHQGKGKKVWMDDLWYEGKWENGMMHGQGICHMNEVDILEGRFEEDVFQD